MTPGSGQRLTARIVGRVQGVGYRWWVRVRAEELGLMGWVANDPNERAVELVAEGPTNVLDTFELLLWDGPPAAHVDRIDAHRDDATGAFSRFDIARP